MKSLFALSLFLYAFAWQLMEPVYQAAESILVLLFLISFIRPAGGTLRRDPAFLICMALLAYLVLAFAYLHFTLPEGMEQNPRFSRYYLKPLLIVVIAYGLTQSRWLSPWTFLLVAWLGLAITLLSQLDTQVLERFLAGRRMDLQFLNAQHAGVIFATALIALTLFLPRAITVPGTRARILWGLFFAVSIVLSLSMVLATQVRAVSLGLLATLPTGCLLYWLTHRSRGGARKSISGGPVMIAAALIITTALSVTSFSNVGDSIGKRFDIAADGLNMEDIQGALSLTNIKMDGVYIRLASWSAATRWIGERPLMGWGPAVAKHLIEREDFFSKAFKKRFGHVHNSYLEVLVALGILGGLILLALTAWIGRCTIQAYRSGAMPRDAFIFAWVFFSFWCVVNFFESYIMYNSGHVLNACIGGFIYYFHMKTRMGSSPEVSSPGHSPQSPA